MGQINPVSAAVRKLRQALGESQQQFAFRMGTAIRTIARYETTRPPRGKALRQLMRLAHETKQFEQGAVFHKAFAEEMSDNAATGIPLALLGPRALAATWPELSEPMGPDIDHQALELMIRNAKEYKAELYSWAEISRRAKAEVLADRIISGSDSELAVVAKKFVEQGANQEEIQQDVIESMDGLMYLGIGLDPERLRSHVESAEAEKAKDERHNHKARAKKR